jgi:hypothetical protein
MARPRVFISSTYFDLRVVRADLEHFIKEIGYEPILFEKGHVPYTKDDALEDPCYREINNCDIVVAIIGGKYGTQSKDQKHSITQRELKTAVELGKQIYVFVEKAVHNEYRTYQANKEVQGFKPVSVDDPKVFALLEEVYALPVGNPISPFELSEDIVHFLREQWSGLFQRFLQEAARQKEVNLIVDLQTTATTLKQLVTYLSETRSKGDEAIKDILLSSHPAFAAIKKITKIPYRVVFHTQKELESLLSTRSFVQDSKPEDPASFEWDNKSMKVGIRILKKIFEQDGRLKIYTPEGWNNDWITQYTYNPNPAPADDDEIPF